ncbi:phytase [Aquabacterium sp. G14]|uniref:phytase n=1 Tax=Aquabacterium sp. G14 TaxID=3130164 RepID=UPI00309987D4
MLQSLIPSPLQWLAATVLCLAPLMAQSAAPTASSVMGRLQAQELRALPTGHWLVVQDDSVSLLSANGQTLGHLALRAEGLDVRARGQVALAVVTDRDTRDVVPIAVDLQRGTLTRQQSLDTDSLMPESACLHQDAQGLVHAVVLGQEGQAQQWVLHQGQAQLLRRLTMPPGAERCVVDDASATMFLLEPEVGLWAYGFTQDAPMARSLVARAAPQGPLPDDAEGLTAGPFWVSVLSGGGRRALVWTQQRHGAWQASKPLTLPRAADALASETSGRATRVWWRDADTQRWSARPMTRPVGAPVQRQTVPFVLAVAQTEAVASRGDAADDPAVWVHPEQPAASRVLGTNKKQGLEVYDLDGRLRQRLPVGRVNNVDVRQAVQMDGAVWDIAVASNRSDNTLTVWQIDLTGTLAEWGRIPSGLNEVYGLCLYRPIQGGVQVFVNDKDGRFRQFALSAPQGVLKGQLLREFAVGSQPEGCVVDDRRARVFLGEEDRGVWTVSAHAHEAAKPTLMAQVGEHLKADVEGLALYHGTRQSYLLVSSQGDHSFAVYEAQPPYRWVGKVRVGINTAQGIDGVSETDGLEVTSSSLGGAFQKGAVVVQDGYKRLPDGTQNFKLIPWSDMARALGLPE